MLTVAEAIQQRHSTRSFKRTPVSEEMILQMLEAARLAPSASNSQPWRFVVVTDAGEKAASHNWWKFDLAIYYPYCS